MDRYTFDIIYRPGVKNLDADGMSRYPHENLSDESIKLEDLTIKAMYSSVNRLPYIEILSCAHINVLEAAEGPGQAMVQIEIRKKESEGR